MPRTRSGAFSPTVTQRRHRLSRRLRAEDDRLMLALLVGYTLLSAVLMSLRPEIFTAAMLMIPLLLTDMVLSPRRVPSFAGFVLAVLLVQTAVAYDSGIPVARWVSIGVVLVMASVLLAVAWRRSRLGVAGLRGDAMLLDLQTRIARHAELPELPRGWHVELSSRGAGQSSFGGDFLAAHRRSAVDEQRLSVVLVDVSGKGVAAGTRSLVLSGAFGALLAAVGPEDFLPKANEYLLHQGWEEGFATAVHLELDLRSGEVEIRSAGHPPAAHFQAHSGRWVVYDEAPGPVLGLLPGSSYAPVRTRLAPGDAMLLYTDGMVERPSRDISRGIDKLLGEAERLVRRGFTGSADALVDKLGAVDDDCALVVLQRAAQTMPERPASPTRQGRARDAERMTGIEPA